MCVVCHDHGLPNGCPDCKASSADHIEFDQNYVSLSTEMNNVCSLCGGIGLDEECPKCGRKYQSHGS